MRLLPYPTAWSGSGSNAPKDGPAAGSAPESVVGGVTGKGVLDGGVIMSKLGNETAKYVVARCVAFHRWLTVLGVGVGGCRAELGRATWRLLYVSSVSHILLFSCA